MRFTCSFFFFFFNDTATTEIYTLSLHDALPISSRSGPGRCWRSRWCRPAAPQDRKSTRLNSSHANISYAVFCLKKKKKIILDVLLTKNSFRPGRTGFLVLSAERGQCHRSCPPQRFYFFF